METETEMLEVGTSLEGKQITVGTVMDVAIKNIPEKDHKTGQPVMDANGKPKTFKLLEFVVGNIQGRVREVVGSATLKVGLSAGNITLQSRIGRLAKGLFGWDGKSRINPIQFKGQDLEFYVEPVEQENGTFWNIDRNSIGVVGHLQETATVPANE